MHDQRERPIRRICVEPVCEAIVALGDEAMFLGADRKDAIGAIAEALPVITVQGIAFQPDESDVKRAVQRLQPAGKLSGKSHYNRVNETKTFEFTVRT